MSRVNYKPIVIGVRSHWCSITANFNIWRAVIRQLLNPNPEGGGGGGGGGTQKSFIRGGAAPKSKPLPFYIPFLTEKVTRPYTFHRKLYPFDIPTERLLLNFSPEKPLEILG